VTAQVSARLLPLLSAATTTEGWRLASGVAGRVNTASIGIVLRSRLRNDLLLHVFPPLISCTEYKREWLSSIARRLLALRACCTVTLRQLSRSHCRYLSNVPCDRKSHGRGSQQLRGHQWLDQVTVTRHTRVPCALHATCARRSIMMRGLGLVQCALTAAWNGHGNHRLGHCSASWATS
jgi:hypothetical protein